MRPLTLSIFLLLGVTHILAAPSPARLFSLDVTVSTDVRTKSDSVTPDYGGSSTSRPCICWKSIICEHEELKCPEGMHSKKFGECWTCCTNEPECDDSDYSFKPTRITNKVEVIQPSEEVCWKACFFEEPQCPKNGIAKRFGDCWTCCFDYAAEAAVDEKKLSPTVFPQPATTSIHVKPDLRSEICWKACFPKKPACPGTAKAKKFGQCWTCCFDYKNEAVVDEKKLSSVSAHSLAFTKAQVKHHLLRDVCWKACFPNKPTCPPGSYANQFGECWTCCFDSAVEAVVDNRKSSSVISHELASTKAHVQSDFRNQICWKACFPIKPKCPEGWHAEEFGECWTCCRGYEDESVEKHKQLVLSPAEHEALL